MQNADWGYVYIIGNEAMPDLFKVGYTLRSPELRAQELNNTGIPYSYKVIFKIETIKPYAVEQQAHKILANNRIGKEWFKCSLNDCTNAIKVAYSSHGGTVKQLEEQRKQLKEEQKKTAEQKILNNEFKELSAKYNNALGSHDRLCEELEERAKKIYPDESLWVIAFFTFLLPLIIGPWIAFSLSEDDFTRLLIWIIFPSIYFLWNKFSAENDKSKKILIKEFVENSDEFKKSKESISILHGNFVNKYGYVKLGDFVREINYSDFLKKRQH